MLKLSVLCLVMLVVGTQANDEDRIVGGKPARPGQIPYQAMLRRSSTLSEYCSGAIISDRIVLSAARCAQGRNSDPAHVKIVVGAHHRSSDGTLISVSRITSHPDFSRNNMQNNICILQTLEKILFSNLIQAVELPSFIFPNITGIALRASGWGQDRVSNFWQFWLLSWERENWTLFYSNRRAILRMIQMIVQISCKFCEQEAWNAETASPAWV